MYMRQKQMNLLKTALIAVSFIVYPLSYAQDEIGVAAAVNTKTVDMVAYPGGNIENRNVDPGYKIISNRTIQTNKSGKAQMLLVDGTAFTIGPNSTVTLDKFIYDPATASGSLEVSAKGLVRLVGGKVTKSKPAIIRTSTATVGIRGGIAIVEATPEETKASFVYGVEMEVSPIKNPDNSLIITQVGLKVEVEADAEEVEEPELITSEELDEYSDEFEGTEEPEEESSENSDSEESSSETEDSSENEVDEESESESEESEESEEAEETNESEEESDETENEEADENDNDESEETESDEPEEAEENDTEEAEETDSEEVDDSEESSGSSSDEESSENDSSSDQENDEASDDNSDSGESSEGDDADSNQSSNSETQDEENSSDESTSQESTDRDDEPSENDSPVETSSSEEDTVTNEDSETSTIDTEEDSQDQSSENVNSNSEISTENTSSDTPDNTSDNNTSVENVSDSQENEVETQPTPDKDQSASEVQRPIVTSSSSSNEASTPTQPNEGREIQEPTQPNEGRETQEPPLVRPTGESVTSNRPITTSSSSDSVTLTQPATATSSSDTVPLVQPPTSTSSSDQVPLVQPPITSSSSDLITLEPINDDPEPVMPEIDESLLDNFDISKNTSETGIDNLTTAYDQGGELFIDETQIDTQEEEFIEEANEANEQVQVEEVQEEQKVEVVIEAQLSANTSFVTNNIEETLSAGSSLGKIDVESSGSGDIRFVLGGSGSENFNIDSSGNITLKNSLDYETRTSYNLLVFTFLGEKSITSKLDFNVIDIDEEPSVNLNLFANSLREDSSTNLKLGEVEIIDPEKNGISTSIVGLDRDKVSISSSGEIMLQASLDYEQKEDLEFTVEVFDGKNTVQTPIRIQIDNVNDLTANVNLANNHLHEGASVNSTVGSISVNGDNTLSYSLSGQNSSDFYVTSDGKIKLAKTLSYNSKNIYDLTLQVKGRNDTVDQPFTIIIKENEAPLISTNCLNGCNFDELTKPGTTIVEANRQDNDTDNISYALVNDFGGKFSINQSTGKVTLSNKLDFESQNSYTLQIKATDSKNLTDTKSIPLGISNVNILPEVDFKTDNTAVSEVNSQIVIREDIDSLADNEQIILVAKSNFTDSNSTFALSGRDAHRFEINNLGEVKAKDLSNPSSAGGIDFESQKNYNITITESRSDESDAVQNFTLLAQNKENDAASVVRYSSAFNSSSRVGFKAAADRGISGTSDNKSIRESILTYEDINANSSISSVKSLGHIRERNGKTEVFTNIIKNGKNENNIASSDWKYEFPLETDNQKESNNFYAPYHDGFDETASLAPQDNDPSENLVQQIIESSYFSGGEGVQTVLTHRLNSTGLGKITSVQLPSSFTYYGNTFSHIHVSENGYIKFSNSSSSSAGPSGNDINTGQQHGVPLMYLFDAADYDFPGGRPDSFKVPAEYSGTNLSNTLFPIWSYFDASSGKDTDIRTLWNPTTGKFVIGFYNLKMTDVSNNEVNVEVILDTNNGEIKFIYGDFGSEFQKLDSGSNTMIGISGDFSQDQYEQVYFCDQNEDCSNFGENDATSTFASNLNKTIDRDQINSMYNASLFANHGKKKVTDFSTITFNPNGSNDYSFVYDDETNNAFLNASDDGDNAGPTFNKSEILSSGKKGSNFSFIWMNLDKAALNITYNTGEESDPGGYASNSPNYKDGSFGTASYASATYNLLEDQITIAGSPYTTEEFNKLKTTYGTNAKRVVAFAPIPIEYTSKYKNLNLKSLGYSNDKQYLKYFLPQFFSADFMNPQHDGGDELFDFDLLQENDYCQTPGAISCTYAINNLENRNLYRDNAHPVSGTKNSTAYNDNYDWVSTALSGQGENEFIKSSRFSGSDNYVPEGQSLWYQIFKPSGRGVGLFVQLNFNCESSNSCSSSNPSFSTQSSFLSVLLNDTDSRANLPGYSLGDTGLAVSGSQFFSYLRKSARNATNDGELAVNYDTPQISFGIMPISCASSSDYGCFWGDQSSGSSSWRAPSGAMISTSDPYKTQTNSQLGGDMNLGVMHAMSQNNSDDSSQKTYQLGTFDQAIVRQKQKDASGSIVESTSLDEATNSWRSIIQTSSNTWEGYLNGFLVIDDGYNQNLEGGITLTFDDNNDRVKITSTDTQFYKLPFQGASGESNNWFRTGNNSSLLPFSYGSQSSQSLNPKSSGHFSLQFGDDEVNKNRNNFAHSAYINKKVFAASLKDEDKAIRAGETNLSNNLVTQSNTDQAGALVSWDTLDNPDKDFISSGTVIPDLEYMTWGFWAMATNDIADNLYNGTFKGAGDQTAAVHLGTWFAGDLLDVSDMPTNYSATFDGAAIFNVFARLNDSSHSYVASGKANANLSFDNTGNWNGTMTISEADKYGPDQFKNWSAIFDLGNNNSNSFSKDFSCNSSGGSSVCSALRGALYGPKANMEMGAQFMYSEESQDLLYMAEGISILKD